MRSFINLYFALLFSLIHSGITYDPLCNLWFDQNDIKGCMACSDPEYYLQVTNSNPNIGICRKSCSDYIYETTVSNGTYTFDVNKCFIDSCPDNIAQIEDPTKLCQNCKDNCLKCDSKLFCFKCDSAKFLIITTSDEENNNTCKDACISSTPYTNEENNICYGKFLVKYRNMPK